MKRISSAPYRWDPKTREFENDEIDKIPEQHVIESSQTEWVAPNVFAHKIDGTLRFSVDHIKLDAVAIHDSYSIPWTGEYFHSLCEAAPFLEQEVTSRQIEIYEWLSEGRQSTKAHWLQIQKQSAHAFYISRIIRPSTNIPDRDVCRTRLDKSIIDYTWGTAYSLLSCNVWTASALVGHTIVSDRSDYYLYAVHCYSWPWE